MTRSERCSPRSPSELRAAAARTSAPPSGGGAAASVGDGLTFRLPYRSPLDADALIAFLARRAVPGVEEVVDGSYRRSLRLPSGAGIVS